jgi:hypothetical protein
MMIYDLLIWRGEMREVTSYIDRVIEMCGYLCKVLTFAGVLMCFQSRISYWLIRKLEYRCVKGKDELNSEVKLLYI